MVLRMARPIRRPGSSFPYFRKRVPADVLRLARGRRIAFAFPGEADGAEVTVSATIGPEVKVSLGTRDPGIAKCRHGLATAQFERFCAAVRSGSRPILQKERVALAGILYAELAQGLEDAPGEPEIWELFKEANHRALLDPARMEQWFGPSVDELLLRKGIITDEQSRGALIQEAARALSEAGEELLRNANGDYRPDPMAERFPKWEGLKSRSQGSPHPTLTFDELFKRWQRETKPAPSTITTWRSYVHALRNHVGHDDPARVTKADIIAWKDALVAAGRSAKGIKDGQLAAVRALFNFAVDNGLLPSNPALGVTVRQSKSAGTRMLPYSDDEVARLLALADRQPHPCRRWLPWLMALSGARVGELAQLWGRRIIHVDGIPVMKIAPAEDGGSLKNEGSERDVPIHPAVLERGFLEFVRSCGDGPLFYGKKRPVKLRPSALSTRRHASKGVANHLAAWIRNEGFTDKR